MCVYTFFFKQTESIDCKQVSGINLFGLVLVSVTNKTKYHADVTQKTRIRVPAGMYKRYSRISVFVRGPGTPHLHPTSSTGL